MSDDLFHGLEPPTPPPDLRDVALRAGRRAFRIDPEPDVWSRLLRSGRVRLAWASSIALLLGGHALLSLRASQRQRAGQELTSRRSAPSAPWQPGKAARSRPSGETPRRGPGATTLEPEITGIARLPRIEDRALAAQPGERS